MNLEFFKTKKMYCVAPMPLLWIFSFLLFYASFIFIGILFLFILIRSLINKKRGFKIFDNANKISLLFLIIFTTYNVIWVFYFMRDHQLYVLSLLFIAASLIVILFLGGKYHLFKNRKIYWILVTILFIGTLALSSVNIYKKYFEVDRSTEQVPNFYYAPNAIKSNFLGTCNELQLF